jgi:glutathione S-transferase
MIKLYGTSMSRAARCLWALEELGLKYEHVPVAPDGGTRKPDYLKVNPNGHVPSIDDNGTVLWESMAINLYLAEKYGKAPLWPSSVEDRARTYQWSFWGMCEVEPQLLTILMKRVFAPEGQKDEKAAQAAAEELKPPLKVLDDYLKNREYLLGNQFTIADLNTASILSLANMVGVDLTPVPTAQKWLQTCTSRESMARAQAAK